MTEPIQKFNITEAIDKYKGDPTVRCLADERIIKIRSNTIHAIKEEGWKEYWIWAYEHDQDRNVLLYAPSTFTEDFVCAEIIKRDETDQANQADNNRSDGHNITDDRAPESRPDQGI